MFWHITLPLLRPYILVALLLRTIFEFRAFDNIYVMTSGGPANATMTLSKFTYLASFVPVRSEPRRRGIVADAADVDAALRGLHPGRPPAGGQLMAALRRRSRRSKLIFAGVSLRRADRADPVFLFPLLWIVGLSLKTRLQVFAKPPLFIWWPTWRITPPYSRRADFLQAFVNSLWCRPAR